MVNFNVLKMIFSSPLHIGQGVTESYGRSGRILHSDSLSGALAATYSAIYPGEDVKIFMESFKLSSGFPFSGKYMFYPKPMIKLPMTSDTDSSNFVKKLKKLEYFDQASFETILLGKEVKVYSLGQFAGKGKYYLSNQDDHFKTPFCAEVVQRVAVPRGEGGDASPFYFERLTFNEDCGFWCFYDIQSEYRQKFLECWIHLGENGLGTDRTVGNGQFKVAMETTGLNLPGSKENNLIMSLFWPTKTDLSGIALDKSSYLLKKRGGFIAGSSTEKFRHLRRKSVYMFSEGSVFSGEAKGKIDNLRPEWNDSMLHPVWRDGRAFTLPIIIKP